MAANAATLGLTSVDGAGSGFGACRPHAPGRRARLC
jgi:hypothetical protein